jgi:hypothetical protein
MAKLNSVAFRLIAAAAVVSLAGLAAGGLLLSNVFRASVERQLDDRLIADMENLIAAAEPGPTGALDVMNIFADQRYDTAFSGWYWQVTADGADGQRLAKRNGGTTIRELVASAMSPTAIIGMLARGLGLTRAAGPLTPAEVAATLAPPADWRTEAWPMDRAP